MMNLRYQRPLRVLAHLLLGLCLMLGLSVLAGGTALVAHAQSAATTTVSTCDESHLDAALASASSGDTINFSCSGDIALTQTLTISKNLTLDGNGQTVTLDGQNTVEVLYVNSGVSFSLNALTVAHGSVTSASASNGYGGGIYNAGTMTISNSTLNNNSSYYAGGGIANFGGTLTISNSTLSNNSATNDHGGGIANFEGTLTISNSTLSNNSAYIGGGIENDSTTLTISNSTLNNNSASYGGGISNLGQMGLVGSIIANNSGGNCYAHGPIDQGYNLSSDGSCGFTGTGSMQNTDPKLDPNGLQNNGGPTQTIALQQGSPAIDQIPTTSCPSADQRGMSRPDEGESTCDIGAYESNYESAAAQVSDLITQVNSFHLANGLQNALDAKLNATLKAINGGQTTTACSDLSDFMGQVQAQTGKGITANQASQLIAAAKQVQTTLGC